MKHHGGGSGLFRFRVYRAWTGCSSRFYALRYALENDPPPLAMMMMIGDQDLTFCLLPTLLPYYRNTELPSELVEAPSETSTSVSKPHRDQNLPRAAIERRLDSYVEILRNATSIGRGFSSLLLLLL